MTHRSLTQGFTVVSGHVPPGDERSTLDWSALARLNTTLVILMGTKHLAAIAAALVSDGKPAATPAAIVQQAGPVSYTHLDVYKRQKGSLSKGGLSKATLSAGRLWWSPPS